MKVTVQMARDMLYGKHTIQTMAYIKYNGWNYELNEKGKDLIKEHGLRLMQYKGMQKLKGAIIRHLGEESLPVLLADNDVNVRAAAKHRLDEIERRRT